MIIPHHLISGAAWHLFLQKASLELGLVYDQLTAKRKTRRYYSGLLLCQQYIRKALEQNIRDDRLQQWAPWRLLSSIQRQNNLYSQSTDVSIHQGRQYQMELPAALEVLECSHKFFRESLEIWPDQCERIFTLLQDIQVLIQETCGFLDALACSQAAVSSYYCQTVVIFHNIHEQLPRTLAQVDRYRAICRSSALRSLDTKQYISEMLASILQHADEGACSFTRLLDLASFQERRASDEYTLSHFA